MGDRFPPTDAEADPEADADSDGLLRCTERFDEIELEIGGGPAPPLPAPPVSAADVAAEPAVSLATPHAYAGDLPDVALADIAPWRLHAALLRSTDEQRALRRAELYEWAVALLEQEAAARDDGSSPLLPAAWRPPAAPSSLEDSART